MTEVWFYHLERSRPEPVLAELLEKTLQRGWRAAVRMPHRDALERLDAALWTQRDDSFIAHGLDDEPNAERQPVLLTTGEDRPNGAQALFLLDGAEPGDIEFYERCIVVFDGSDEDRLQEARSLWKACRAAGRSVSYWKQGESGGWVKQG